MRTVAHIDGGAIDHGGKGCVSPLVLNVLEDIEVGAR
jgi:hypothetical protein